MAGNFMFYALAKTINKPNESFNFNIVSLYDIDSNLFTINRSSNIVAVFDKDDKLIGFVKKGFSFCGTKFKILDENKNEIYSIKSSTNFNEVKIFTGQKRGSILLQNTHKSALNAIIKPYINCCIDSPKSNDDHEHIFYQLHFPEGASIKERCLLISLVLFINSLQKIKIKVNPAY